jgi:hypothetical protein
LWRAATAEKDGRFVTELASEPIARAVVLASQAEDAVGAANQFNDALDERQASGIVFDLARRALLKSVVSREGASGFAQELFVEAANYYASRDLPSFVAARGRVATTSDSVSLKDQIRELTRRAVAPIANDVARAIRDRKSLDRKAWGDFVRLALDELRKRRPK